MNNRAYALFTGLFVMFLAAAAVTSVFWMGGSHKETRPYVVVTTGNVGGLQPQSTVFYRGISAGSVGQIRLDPQDNKYILIDVAINRDVPVTRGTYASLKLQGITGLSVLELEDAPDATDTSPLATNMPSPARILMKASLIDQLSNSGAELADQLVKLTSALNTVLDQNGRDHIKGLLAEADESAARLAELERDLDTEARNLPALDKHSEESLAEIQQAAASIRSFSQNLDRMTAKGQTAGGDLADRTIPQLDAALAHITRAANDLDLLTQNLRRDPQQLLLGPARPAPGPGEPDYKGPGL